MASLLSCLQFFSRQYYQVVEEMVMALSGDDSEVVSQAMGQQLLPVLQVQCSRGRGVTARREWWESVAGWDGSGRVLCLPWELESCPNPFQSLSMPILPQVWAVKADVVATSLLPKVVSELSGRLRQATAQYGAGPPSSPTAQPGSSLIFPNQDFQARCGGGRTGFLGMKCTALLTWVPVIYYYVILQLTPFPLPPFLPRLQAAHHLLGLYASLLPALRQSALRSCPSLPPAPTPSEQGAEDRGASSSAPGGVATDAGHLPRSSGRSSSASIEDAADCLDATAEGRRQADTLFEGWAGSERHAQWKSVQWVVQVRGVCAVVRHRW